MSPPFFKFLYLWAISMCGVYEININNVFLQGVGVLDEMKNDEHSVIQQGLNVQQKLRDFTKEIAKK